MKPVEIGRIYYWPCSQGCAVPFWTVQVASVATKGRYKIKILSTCKCAAVRYPVGTILDVTPEHYVFRVLNKETRYRLV